MTGKNVDNRITELSKRDVEAIEKTKEVFGETSDAVDGKECRGS